MPTPEIEKAKGLYLWLWLAPILQLFAAPFVGGFVSVLMPKNVNWLWSVAVTALVLGLAHLRLLLPAIDAKSEFVRWHARQAFLIATIQTLILPVALIAGVYQSDSNGIACLGAVAAPIFWFVSNIRGRDNAARGDCTLMRWSGHGAILPLPAEIGLDPAASASSSRADDLVQIIRTSRNESARRTALGDLQKLGLVEEL